MWWCDFRAGHNAGHTLVVGNQTYKLSLLPSGLVRGKLGVIGNGVVVDPEALLAEIARVRAQGLTVTPETLRIAENAVLILPLHPALDRAREEARGDAGSAPPAAASARPTRTRSPAAPSASPTSPNRRRCRRSSTNCCCTTTPCCAGSVWRRSSKEALLDGLLALAPQILPFAEPVWERLDELRRGGKRILFEGARR